MAFTTFIYQKLTTNILNLTNTYSSLIGRYTLTDDIPEKSSSPSSPPPKHLLILYDRTNKYVSQCIDTDRETQRNVFTQILLEIKPYIESEMDEEDSKRFYYFLLGALIHRHERLIIEYDNYNTSNLNPVKFFGYKVWKIQNCGLYNAIRTALQLDGEHKKVLDEYTIIKALEVFKKNMLMEVEDVVPGSKDTTKKIKQARYKFYPHFIKDANFITHLDEIIGMHKKKKESVAIIKQFQAIAFIKSVTTEIVKENKLLTDEMGAWITIFSKAHADFAKVTQETMLEHLESYFQSMPDKQPIKDKISGLMKLGFKANRFNDNYSSFQKIMIQMATDQSRCILCGAYVLLLTQEEIDEKLLSLIYQAIGLESKLGVDDQLDCLKDFKGYIEQQPSPKLDFDFFGGKDKLLTHVLQGCVSLVDKKHESQLVAQM